MPLSAGDQLGPYEILAPIGSGGMGEVWKARDTRLGRIVAIKRLKAPHGERFEQEARAVAALNHPNICQIHDIGPDYLVLEYIEGKPLPGPLPVQEAVRLAIQIASALEEAHGRGILHRDLKPANILVTAKGTVKLLDFRAGQAGGRLGCHIGRHPYHRGNHLRHASLYGAGTNRRDALRRKIRRVQFRRRAVRNARRVTGV